MQAQSRSVGNSWRTASAAVRAAVAARQLQQREQRRAKKQEKAKKKAKDGEQPPDSGPTAEDVSVTLQALPCLVESIEGLVHDGEQERATKRSSYSHFISLEEYETQKGIGCIHVHLRSRVDMSGSRGVCAGKAIRGDAASYS